MTTKTLININQITKIVVNIKVQSKHEYIVYKPKNIIDLIAAIRGKFKPYWRNDWDSFFNSHIKDIEKFCEKEHKYIECDKLYYMPHLIIFSSDGDSDIKFFRNENVLEKAIMEIKELIPTIEINYE